MKKCPNCNSKAILVFGKMFKCKKCGYINKPTEKKNDPNSN